MHSPDKTPTVFISYSHDSREHKTWVASLAQRLREKGVEVLFDQWDLNPGDDVPKFMEQAVARSDRVLMICSEAYVRKANDGEGGVGYEAMVVTGVLVRNLGTNKFVPIVRQTNSPNTLPHCVSTRLYVDLSDGANLEENFELLLRELHNVPKVAKPPLGTNPFGTGQFEGAGRIAAKIERRLEFTDALASPEAAYQRALEIIRDDDRVAWRKLLLAANDKAAELLKRWKSDTGEIPPTNGKNWSALYAHAQTGLESYVSFIACLIAAAETGKAGYADQLGWVESILNPNGYDTTTTIYHAHFPQLVFFVTQALVGGMLMTSEAGEAAHALATTKVTDQSNPREALPLFEMTRLNGWPDSLNHECTVAWGFLDSVLSSWTWIKGAFGSEMECRAGISAYYQLLSFLNCLKLAKGGYLNEDKRESLRFPVSVPVCFCMWPPEVVMRGFDRFLRQSIILKRVLDANQIDDATFVAAWPKWISIVSTWLDNVYRGYWPYIPIVQSKLPEHFKRLPFVLDP